MSKDYIVLFRGSSIEAGRVIFDLEQIGIKGVVRDQQTSAARSGFAIPAAGDEVLVLVHRDEHTARPSLSFSYTFFRVMLLAFHLTYTRQKSYVDQSHPLVLTQQFDSQQIVQKHDRAL